MRSDITEPRVVLGPVSRPVTAPGRRDLSIVAACALTACAVSWFGCAMHNNLGPLWFDESGTGAFASEPSLAGLTELARGDSNAPLYYYLMWFWARAFGVSNAALHLPSLLASMATPLIAWVGLRRSRPMLACVWAALLALWIPGMVLSEYARCYALLSCLSVATAVAAIRAYDVPTRGRASVWAAAACLTTLTHYFAGPLALVQGLVLTARYRGRWREAWPAGLMFLPAFAWIGWQAPQLAAYARPGVAWYDPFTLADLPIVVSKLIGPPLSQAALPAALVVGMILKLRAGETEGSRGPADRAVIATGLASLATVGLCLVLAALRPTFTFRYLTPYVPGVLLLVSAGVVAVGRGRWQPPALLIAGSFVSAVLSVASEDVARDKAFSFEAASAWIAGAEPTRLAFFWDNPATQVVPARQLDAIGGFFLRRAGHAVAVAPVRTIRESDMNAPVLAAAGPAGAILWLYDTTVHDTTAILHPPRLDATTGRECRDFGILNLGILACRPGR